MMNYIQNEILKATVPGRPKPRHSWMLQPDRTILGPYLDHTGASFSLTLFSLCSVRAVCFGLNTVILISTTERLTLSLSERLRETAEEPDRPDILCLTGRAIQLCMEPKILYKWLEHECHSAKVLSLAFTAIVKTLLTNRTESWSIRKYIFKWKSVRLSCLMGSDQESETSKLTRLAWWHC